MGGVETPILQSPAIWTFGPPENPEKWIHPPLVLPVSYGVHLVPRISECISPQARQYEQRDASLTAVRDRQAIRDIHQAVVTAHGALFSTHSSRDPAEPDLLDGPIKTLTVEIHECEREGAQQLAWELILQRESLMRKRAGRTMGECYPRAYVFVRSPTAFTTRLGRGGSAEGE